MKINYIHCSLKSDRQNLTHNTKAKDYIYAGQHRNPQNFQLILFITDYYLGFEAQLESRDYKNGLSNSYQPMITNGNL